MIKILILRPWYHICIQNSLTEEYMESFTMPRISKLTIVFLLGFLLMVAEAGATDFSGGIMFGYSGGTSLQLDGMVGNFAEGFPMSNNPGSSTKRNGKRYLTPPRRAAVTPTFMAEVLAMTAAGNAAIAIGGVM